MDMAAYLEKKKELIAIESRHVKNFSVFEFNYVPPQPLMRDECRTLIDAMLRFEVSGIASHHVVIGSRGSGKTLSLRYLERELPQQTSLRILYVNCRQHNTSYRIFSHLLGVPAAGTSLSDLFQRLLDKFARSKVVLILDEVDLMSPKDKRREILYLLSRCAQPFMLILLSNSPHVIKQLDTATQSSLQPTQLLFRQYTAPQINEILEDRANRGLHHWQPDDLAKVAALTVRLSNADTRVAIKTLLYLVTRHDEKLEACFEHARRDILMDVINDLSDANLLILWAIAVSERDLARAIYQRYQLLSRQQGDKPFSYVHFSSSLGYLQSLGVLTLISTKQQRTYAHRILLTFDTAIVTGTARVRFS